MNDKIETDEWFDRLYGVPLLGGLLAGVVSFVLGGLAFLGLAAATGDGFDFEQPVRRVKEDVLTFYNSFRVPTYERSTAISEQQAENATAPVQVEEVLESWFNPLTDTEQEMRYRVFLDGGLRAEDQWVEQVGTVELTFPAELYLAIPVVVLAGVGVGFAYRFVGVEGIDAQKDLIQRTLVGGATIALGFLLVVLAGTYGVQIEEEGKIIRPDRIDALFYGLVYPAVFATGGVLAGLLLDGPEFDSERGYNDDEPGDEEPDTDDGTDTGGEEGADDGP